MSRAQGTTGDALVQDEESPSQREIITINGQLALRLDLAIAEPTPLLNVTGGVIAFRDHHPRKDGTLRACLLGAAVESAAPAAGH